MASPSLAVLLKAYRQAKLARAAEKTSVGADAFATFEIGLASNLAVLATTLADDQWFDGVNIGRVVVVPKAFLSPTGESDDNSEGLPLVRIGSPGPPPTGLAVRLQLEPSVEFAVAEILYLWEFGPALEALLAGDCVGYRLHRVIPGGAIDTAGRHLYGYWPKAFRSYRDAPIAVARQSLDRGERVTVINTDIASFFDSLDPGFLRDSSFERELLKTAAALGRALNLERYRRATNSLLRAFARFRDLRYSFGAPGLEPATGVPIGSLTARIVANVALYGFDRYVRSRPGVLLYRRYVDDIVVVLSGAKAPLTVMDTLGEVFPLDRRTSDSFVGFSDPETGVQLSFNREKTRVHDLVGRAAIDFLDSVRDSFSLVTSESRAFIGQLDVLENELEAIELFGDGGVNDGPPRLRDADRFTLRRYMGRVLLRGLEKTALLLGEGAEPFLQARTQRILSIVEIRPAVEDLEVIISLLKTALACRCETVAGAVDSWLENTFIVRMRASSEVIWQQATLATGQTLEAAEAYVRERQRQAHHAAGGFRGPFGAAAKRARLAGLRYLDREDDWASHRLGWPRLNREFREQTATVIQEASSDPDLRESFERIEQLRPPAGRASDAWRGATALQFYLDGKPPRHADISRWVLADPRNFLADIGAKINRTANAVLGTRYSLDSGDSLRFRIDRSRAIGTLPGEDARQVRVVLASLLTTDEQFDAAARGTPILSLERVKRLNRALRDVEPALRGSNASSTILVLPELSVPRSWARALAQHATKRGFAVIFGLEYKNRGTTVENQAVGVFPGRYRTAATLCWTKKNPAQGEAEALIRLGRSFGETAARSRLILDSQWGRLSVLICSELLESAAVAELTGQVELIVVPAWNRDTSSFEHLVHAAASLTVHAFVAVSNSAIASDSRIVGPISQPRHRREVCRLLQRDESRAIWADLDLGTLRDFHEAGPIVRAPQKQDEKLKFRPLPPGWPPRRG